MNKTETIPANTGDIYNYAMNEFYVPEIHMFLKFEKKLDLTILRNAIKCCFISEPVLRTFYVSRWIKPYWKKIPIENLPEYLKIVENLTHDEESVVLNKFLSFKHDEKIPPQIQLLLLRSKKDKLIIKINHQIVDAEGLKEMSYLLSSYYKTLLKNPEFIPSENKGSRSMKPLFRKFFPFKFMGIYKNYFSTILNTINYSDPLVFPAKNITKGLPKYLIHDISLKKTKFLIKYSKNKDATINDIMVAAILRSLIKFIKPSGKKELQIVGTVNLRRYLDSSYIKGLCNLSSFYLPFFGKDPGENFEDTLEIVKTTINKLKNDYLGLGFILGSFTFLAPYPYVGKIKIIKKIYKTIVETGKLTPAFTNMGKIDENLLDFGNTEVLEAKLLVPPVYPPAFILGLSGFKNSLTLTTGFFESSINKDDYLKMFELIDGELPDEN
jgi:NRPS condensation-like uncharacterized protein